MKHLIVATTTALALSVAPATAQETEEGLDLMEEGAKLLLRGLMSEMEPALKELEDFAQDVGPAMQMLADEMGPALAKVLNSIDDISNYDAPEVLPNGDIIIRRRADAPPYEGVEEIDL